MKPTIGYQAPTKPSISVVSLLSYDWYYSILSIASYCHHVDEIIVGLDINRRSYSGQRFVVPDPVINAICDLPGVRIVEDDVYAMSDHTIGRETLQRNALVEQTKGDWVFQIDADEIALNPSDLVTWVSSDPVVDTVRAHWRTIWKRIEDKYLVIDESDSYSIWIGSRGKGLCGRSREPGIRLSAFDPQIADKRSPVADGLYIDKHKRANAVLCPLVLLHHSYDRSEEEVAYKLANWSHSDHWPTGKMLELWKSTTLENYHQIKNFFPVDACKERWAGLTLHDRASLYRVKEASCFSESR